MNELIKQSIDAKKKAIYDYHDVTSVKTKEKIDDFFEKVEEFGSNYTDIMQFENDFTSSSLMKEYTDLFTLVIQSENVNEMIHDTNVANEIGDSFKNHIRRKTREKRDQELRNMPVIGDILNVKQHIDLFSKFRKKDE